VNNKAIILDIVHYETPFHGCGLLIGAGTIFRLGEQKLNFSVLEAKFGEKTRQSNSKYNFMQYVFFQKIYAVYIGVWSKSPGGEFSRIFVLKVTLQSVSTSSGSQELEMSGVAELK